MFPKSTKINQDEILQHQKKIPKVQYVIIHMHSPSDTLDSWPELALEWTSGSESETGIYNTQNVKFDYVLKVIINVHFITV